VAFAVWVASAFTSEATTAKPRPASPGPRSLDGGVESQQIRLASDVSDESHHFINTLGSSGERPHCFVCRR